MSILLNKGTTGVACKNLDKEYCEIAMKRINEI